MRNLILPLPAVPRVISAGDIDFTVEVPIYVLVAGMLSVVDIPRIGSRRVLRREESRELSQLPSVPRKDGTRSSSERG